VGGTVSLANSFPDLALELFRCGQARDEQRGRRFRIGSPASIRPFPALRALRRQSGYDAGRVPRRYPAEAAAAAERGAGGSHARFLAEEGLL